MNAIILCGGLGTRLGELTKHTPKILMKIGGKTVFDWQMEKLQSAGIKEVVLAAGHLADVLKERVGEKWQDIKIIYAIEPKRLGTGGAIKFAANFMGDKNSPTIILNGDVLTSISFFELSQKIKSENDGIILGAKVDDASAYGTIIFDENYLVKEFREKEGKKIAGCINAGVYLFNPNAFVNFPDREEFSIEYDVFPNLKNLYVHDSSLPWVDIGVPERLEWAEKNWHLFLN